MKSNFPVGIVGSVASPEDAKVATGLAGTGAERLLGQGDFLVVAKGQVTRMQAAYLDSAEVRGLVARLREGARPLLLTASETLDSASPWRGLKGRLRERLRRIR
jgi:DNA segregation ATPase FtsK/SpoIIIE-like protein